MTQQPKNDDAGFMLGMILFAIVIPALFGLSVNLPPYRGG